MARINHHQSDERGCRLRQPHEPAPVTFTDPHSKSGGGVTNVATPRSPKPLFNRLSQRPRPVRRPDVALSAYTAASHSYDDEMEDLRNNCWRTKHPQPEIRVASKNEVPERLASGGMAFSFISNG
ncbi:hypothetical protein EG328_006511 [Venturia inaequalis]|uniref:Uncharacterized protein n=1 Tax=Venturia inaequalis TaxID=5025 RepID=A0A8H3YQR9_VENIN|nr:hypothetical protein EG328_006511 [Venturia inaequalis]KAE9991679.1 hypothetical protein EG327_011222 [Venturia inaequalis]